jgi:hypothetical protein
MATKKTYAKAKIQARFPGAHLEDMMKDGVLQHRVNTGDQTTSVQKTTLAAWIQAAEELLR